MTADTIKGQHVFTCDACPEAIEPENQDSFGEAWTEAKAQGWVCWREEGTFKHRCPDCAT